MIREDANAEFCDADSSHCDQTRWETRSGPFTNRVQQKIVRTLMADWRGAEVLEVGPGTARFTTALARQGNQLTLVDSSSGMLVRARENLRPEGVQSAVVDIQVSLYDVPLDVNRFDHAICLNVLSHLENVRRALAQLTRVIKPGGNVLVDYPNLQSYWSPAARRAIDQAALDLLTCRGHVHVPRTLERYPLLPLVQLLDVASRRAPLNRVAPVHFYLRRKRS